MMIMTQHYNAILYFYFVVMMKNNVNISGNVQWNIIFFFVQHPQQKLNKEPNQILHVLDQDLDLGNETNFIQIKKLILFVLSGRTECQAATLGNLARRSMNFERKASQRFSRRASYAIRKKIQEQEILREQEDERLKKLKSEQEAKLDETKKSPE
jgi:hypothetical protein